MVDLDIITPLRRSLGKRRAFPAKLIAGARKCLL
jgi:hypothetical protein